MAGLDFVTFKKFRRQRLDLPQRFRLCCVEHGELMLNVDQFEDHSTGL